MWQDKCEYEDGVPTMDPHYNNKCVDGVEGVDHEYHNGT